MFRDCKNTNKKGDLGLGLAIAYFSSKGWCVSIPLTDSQDYDLVVEIEGKLSKVQVKATSAKAANGNFVVPLRTRGGTYKNPKASTEVFYDVLFVVTEDKEHYLIPKVDLGKFTAITLGRKYAKYKVEI